MSSADDVNARRIAIVGAGFAGVATAYHVFRRVADAHAETIAAERAARAELAGRVRALAGEATRERRAQAKVYLLGACVAAGCAATSGASYGVLGVEPITGKASETAAFAAHLKEVAGANPRWLLRVVHPFWESGPRLLGPVLSRRRGDTRGAHQEHSLATA